MSSLTSSPAAMIRRTWAPILVWCCTFQRKMSPTLMCTRSRSAASRLPCELLPLPGTPMMTYFRMQLPSHTGPRGAGRVTHDRRLPAPVQPALAAPADLGVERAGQHRPVLPQQPRVHEPRHVVAAALGEHDP